jgi:hypothetical protein
MPVVPLVEMDWRDWGLKGSVGGMVNATLAAAEKKATKVRTP